MTHGGLPPRRPDQMESATPRTVAPGQRATQVTNSKTSPLTVQIINKPGSPVATEIINQPGTPVTTQDGGVTNMQLVQAYTNDGGTANLLNPGVLTSYQLWTLTMSSVIATATGTGVVQVDDAVTLQPGGNVIGALVNGFGGASGQSPTAVTFDLKGVVLTLSAIESLKLQAGTTGYTHRVSAVLGYTVL